MAIRHGARGGRKADAWLTAGLDGLELHTPVEHYRSHHRGRFRSIFARPHAKATVRFFSDGSSPPIATEHYSARNSDKLSFIAAGPDGRYDRPPGRQVLVRRPESQSAQPRIIRGAEVASAGEAHRSRAETDFSRRAAWCAGLSTNSPNAAGGLSAAPSFGQDR